MSSNLENCYRILELHPGTSHDDVEQAYRVLVKVWHPGRFANDPTMFSRAQEKMKQINAAYETICNTGTIEHLKVEASLANPTSQKSPPQSNLKKRLLMILTAAIITCSIKACVNMNNTSPPYQAGQNSIRRLSYQEIVDMYKERAAKYPSVASMGLSEWSKQMQHYHGASFDFSAAFQSAPEATSGNDSAGGRQ